MESVTVFCPLMTTGAGELVVHTTGETSCGVDCKVDPAKSVGHVKTTFAPEGITVSCGALTDPNERLNTVPSLPGPLPYSVVPYRVLPDNFKPADGRAPSSAPVKL